MMKVKTMNSAEKSRYIRWLAIILAIFTTLIIQSCDTESTNPYEDNSAPEVISITITTGIDDLPDRTILAGDI